MGSGFDPQAAHSSSWSQRCRDRSIKIAGRSWDVLRLTYRSTHQLFEDVGGPPVGELAPQVVILGLLTFECPSWSLILRVGTSAWLLSNLATRGPG